jgi:hypothetical protein
MLRKVGRQLFTDVSEQQFGPIFKDQAIQEDCLTLKNGTDRLSRKALTCTTKHLRKAKASMYEFSLKIRDRFGGVKPNWQFYRDTEMTSALPRFAY